MKKDTTLGLILGSRRYFPGYLCEAARSTMLNVCAEEGIHVITLDQNDTEYGSVSNLDDAQKCANLFRSQRDAIDGILVSLPNFGDERSIANTLRWAELNVPVLVHAYPDTEGHMTSAERRDSFCGKLSVNNNLTQYNIPFSLTSLHTVEPNSESFRVDLRKFAAVCRVVRGMRRVRIGMLGARPVAFNTVRFSEKLLERTGISVETLDLSEAFGRIMALADGDPRVQTKVAEIQNYARTIKVPEKPLIKIAKLGVVMDEWVKSNCYDATAVQCWTSMQEFFGVFPCTIMSMLSNGMSPSACETDVVGAIGMYVLALASGKPSALVDWNNNYRDDPNKGIAFHCSNLPRSIMVDEIVTIESHSGTADTFGSENSWGMLFGRIQANPFTYLRINTNENQGKIVAYLGEGTFTNDPESTFGGYGVIEIPKFQDLLKYISKNGFEHHVSVNMAQVADVIYEAFTTYLGWDVYRHG